MASMNVVIVVPIIIPKLKEISSQVSKHHSASMFDVFAVVFFKKKSPKQFLNTIMQNKTGMDFKWLIAAY